MWFRRRPRLDLEGSAPPKGPSLSLERPAADPALLFEVKGKLADQLRLVALYQNEPLEALAADMLARGLEQEALRARAKAALESLTPREREVAWLVTRGCTNRQIAAMLEGQINHGQLIIM